MKSTGEWVISFPPSLQRLSIRYSLDAGFFQTSMRRAEEMLMPAQGIGGWVFTDSRYDEFRDVEPPIAAALQSTGIQLAPTEDLPVLSGKTSSRRLVIIRADEFSKPHET